MMIVTQLAEDIGYERGEEFLVLILGHLCPVFRCYLLHESDFKARFAAMTATVKLSWFSEMGPEDVRNEFRDLVDPMCSFLRETSIFGNPTRVIDLRILWIELARADTESHSSFLATSVTVVITKMFWILETNQCDQLILEVPCHHCRILANIDESLFQKFV